jgi:ABC-type antimicrobial peptide transport system permease subunit
LGSNTGDFEWEGKDPNKQVLITIEGVSPEYISTMGMKLEVGRDFNEIIKADSNNVIINEAFAKIINKKDVIGSLLNWGGKKITIVGVVNDFIYNNMYSSPAPLVMYADTSNTSCLTMRFKPGTNLTTALPAVEKVIKTYNPGYPFESTFVDTEFDKIFKTETLIGKLAGIFSILAIFISCLGLFGLAAYTAERRTKEIGVRKVLGANTQGLAAMLSKDFLLLVTISCLLAFPLAWWGMNNWLQSYTYRVEIHWTVFALSGLLALLIAVLTVSFQAVKAALANPIKSLRTE